MSNPQSLNRYRYGLNNPLRYRDSSGRYEEDFHRGLTNALALAVGFSKADASRIAQADQYTDDNPATNPIKPLNLSARKNYHFTSPERRDELLSRALETRSLDDLGTYLHALQDSYSHRGYGYRIGHVRAGHDPDRTYNDPGKAVQAAEATYNALAQFQAAQGGSEPLVDFKEIAPPVQEFAEAETNTRKEFILGEIARKAEEAAAKKASAGKEKGRDKEKP